MSDCYWFDTCPVCQTEVTEKTLGSLGIPELSGYLADKTNCSKCKTVFTIEAQLIPVKKKKT